MNFKPKSQNELATLKDDELIAHAVAARGAGRADQFELAVGIFIAGRERMVRAMVGGKVPSHAVDDVVGEVMVSAIESLSRIEGIATGQFVNWLKQIVIFRVADFHKKLEGKPKDEPIGSAGDDGTDDDWLVELVDHGADRSGEVEVLIVFREVLESYGDAHRRAVWLRIQHFPSIEVAETINRGYGTGEIEKDGSIEMTPANVDQIYSRFKKQMRKRLGLGGGS
ncbi:MAG: hypothetical protein BGO23_13780 [Solirubrobacterales bacterium 67-14]|nr:MAG: hypothetical protein BGO23_13780 [Solirubrobacterales bacterium 67-14]